MQGWAQEVLQTMDLQSNSPIQWSALVILLVNQLYYIYTCRAKCFLRFNVVFYTCLIYCRTVLKLRLSGLRLQNLLVHAKPWHIDANSANLPSTMVTLLAVRSMQGYLEGRTALQEDAVRWMTARYAISTAFPTATIATTRDAPCGIERRWQTVIEE